MTEKAPAVEARDRAAEGIEATRSKIRKNIERTETAAAQQIAQHEQREQEKAERASGMVYISEMLMWHAEPQQIQDALDEIEKATRKGKRGDALVGLPLLRHKLGISKAITSEQTKNIQNFSAEDIQQSMGYKVFEEAMKKYGCAVVSIKPYPALQVIVDFDPKAAGGH